MKELILVRHAKAESENSNLSDELRPLSSRGRRDSSFMAKNLQNAGYIPGLIVSSPALRTWATSVIFDNVINIDGDIIPEPVMYQASKYDLLKITNRLSNEFKTVMLTGHNPGISEFASYLTGTSFQFSTCTVMVIEFSANDWLQISNGTGTVKWHDYPKKHTGNPL